VRRCVLNKSWGVVVQRMFSFRGRMEMGICSYLEWELMVVLKWFEAMVKKDFDSVYVLSIFARNPLPAPLSSKAPPVFTSIQHVYAPQPCRHLPLHHTSARNWSKLIQRSHHPLPQYCQHTLHFSAPTNTMRTPSPPPPPPLHPLVPATSGESYII
jgi:hypothetical protein